MTYWDRLFNSINNPIMWGILIVLIIFGGILFLLGDPEEELKKVKEDSEK